MHDVYLKDDERIDDTGFGGIRVIQSKAFGYGVDSVLLAAFAAGETGASGIRKGLRIADLGTGSGIVAFIISHKVRDAVITGYELQCKQADRAMRACRMNGLEDSVDIVNCDIGDIGGMHDFDAVVTNPPFFRRSDRLSDGESNADIIRYTSRHETTADIYDFTSCAGNMLKKGGSLYMVHRPDRLADIFGSMRQADIEPKEMQLVVPSDGRPANIVLIHGIKNAGQELKMLPQIAVHKEDGSYTDIILKIYERN